MSDTGAPLARFWNSTVWTGSEMIVWGGFNNIETGGRYDPINNNWQSTSMGANLPSPRYRHSGVWTGSEMLIWGGRRGNSNTGPLTNTLGIYYPYNTHVINGTLTGLNGDEVVLQYNGDNITLTDNGAFIIDNAVIEGSDYNINVVTNPQNPTQLCTVTNGVGTDIMADVNIDINCTNVSFNVGVTVSGLTSGNSVILENNGSDALVVSTNNVLTNFSQPILDGMNYSISINTQPTSPNQICSIAAGQASGTVNGADVNVTVTCITESYNVGVTVTGLAAGNSVTFTNNGGDALEINNNNTLANFSQPIGDGMDYQVSVTSQPTSPNQVCSIAAGQGTGAVNGADVNIMVTCVADSYNIGVMVTGLATGNSVTFTNNGGDALVVNTNNTLTSFSQPIGDGMAYQVTVTTQPTSPNQVCSLVTGQEAGTVNGTDVIIAVECITSSYFIDVVVTGLSENNSIELSTNGQSLVFNSNTILNFPDPLTDGTSYMITVTQQPNMPSQFCMVLGGNGANNDGSGEIDGSGVEISVFCNSAPMKVSNTFTVFQLMLLICMFCFMGYRAKPGN